MSEATALQPWPHHATGRLATPSLRKRAANDYMRRGLRRLDPNEPIPFFCECELPDCYAVVSLGAATFDQIRAGRSSSTMLARHHDPPIAT